MRLVLLAIVLLPIAVQIFASTRFDDLRFFMKYWTLAEELAAGEISTDRLNDVSPLYLWFVTLLRAVAFSPEAVRTLQLTMNAATSLLAASIALRVAGPVAAVSTALFLVLNRALFINATELEPEAMIVLLNSAALYFLFARSASKRRTFAAGLFFGLSATARLVVLPAAFLAGAGGLWMAHRNDEKAVRRFALPFLSGLTVPLMAALLLTFALTGNFSIMNPGTVFYEGWNPYTSGYALTEPLIVSDVRNEIDAPDPLHLAYRLIASRITGEPASPELANQFWTARAFDFVGAFPGEAFRLGITKLFLSVHSYDAWDLPTMVRRYREAGPMLWIPFGLLVGLSLISLVDRPRDPVVIALWCYSLCYVAILVAFYVTSRQRNAMVPAIAILAGIGISALAARFPRDRRGVVLRTTFVVLLGVLLTRTYHWQAEDDYQWTASFNSEAVVAQVSQAEQEGREDDEMRLRAIDRTWLLGDDPHIPAAPRSLVGAVAKGELSREPPLQRIFDLAIALQYAREWSTSDQILAFLEESGYRPIRQTKAVNSVAYYRALAAFHTGHRDAAVAHLEIATAEAPADSYVLALRSVLLDDDDARNRLFLVHDRLTAGMALARAHYETGNISEALRQISAVTAEMPEWNRARLLEKYLTDLSETYDSDRT